MDTIEFVNWYYNKTSKIMLDLGLSNKTLFLMIPNNIKRRHGFPASRWPGKHKRSRKQGMKSHVQYVLRQRIFDYIFPEFDRFIGEIIQRAIDNLVDYTDIDLGDTVRFTISSNE